MRFTQEGAGDRMTIDASGNVNIATNATLSNGTLTISKGSGSGYSTQISTNYAFPKVNTQIDAIAGDQYSGQILFRTSSGGGSVSERMRIDSSGRVLINRTSSASTNGRLDVLRSSGEHCINCEVAGTSNATLVGFFNGNGFVGGINTSGSATSYNTSSDARLKDVTGEARGLEVINELNPVSYNWKADGKADEGLIAQEVLDIVPNAVSGLEEEMYQMDYSKLVVHLVKAIQEQQEEIETLKAEVKELKDNG